MERSDKQLEFDALRSFVSGMRTDMELIERGIFEIQKHPFLKNLLTEVSLIPKPRIEIYKDFIMATQEQKQCYFLTPLNELFDETFFNGFFIPPFDEEDKELAVTNISQELSYYLRESKDESNGFLIDAIGHGLKLSYGIRLRNLLDDYSYFSERSHMDDHPFKMGWAMWGAYAMETGVRFANESHEEETYNEARGIMLEGLRMISKNKRLGSDLLRKASEKNGRIKNEIKDYFLK